MYRRENTIHFVGIGGVGMAGIAEVLVNLGYRISGSDLTRGLLVKHLENLGVPITTGSHRADTVTADTAVVVVSSAVSAENPEVLRAREHGIPVIPRAEMLAELMRMKYGIAVAGSHGKTTTTSLIGHVLRQAGVDPTVIVGGRVLSDSSGAKLGLGDYLVAEADESDGSFCFLNPAIAVVTNIDREHLSHYGSFGALEEAFSSFMARVPFYGLIVASGDDASVRQIVARQKRRCVLYGFAPDVAIRAEDITVSRGCSEFTLSFAGTQRRVSLALAGSHMVQNSLAAIAVALEIGVAPQEIIAALETFPGVARRLESVGSHAGITILDDYGHHPVEIAATLRAVRRGWLDSSAGRLVVLFQPHRYSRTQELFADFLSCFADADTLYLEDIYPAGEAPIDGIDAAALHRAMSHPDRHYIPNFESQLRDISGELREGDVVVTLGAGSVNKIGPMLLELLQQRPLLIAAGAGVR